MQAFSGRRAFRKSQRGTVGGVLLCCCLIATCGAADIAETPVSPDGSVRISLFAEAPDIVTPIGATVDSRGRLLVIESASHFRPKNYQGPPTDRIRIFQDTKGSGRADSITTFFEGVKLMMNLVTDRDGSIVVSSRNEIFRLEDLDGVAGQKTTLASLETTATYPHNGLHGLAVDSERNVYFGIGENLGAPWTLVGADGKKFSDKNGDGIIFRVDGQGRGLTRIARGFWNPFGLGFDPLGKLWMVDNDPDGRPPCRLIQVAPGGDYGFQFRYGRSGFHPLQAWDGELPGTLGMITGVGEGACAVRWFRGELLVTSWRDHEIESYKLTPRGASYGAAMKRLVTGGNNFRPVALAVAADGSVFVTDWVLSNYELHGKGRIWKLTFTQPETTQAKPEPTAAMQRADRLRESRDVAKLAAALGDEDPAIAQAAQFGLSKLAECEKIDLRSLASPEQRIGLLAALLWRGADVTPDVKAALGDPDVRVREMGVRLVTEQDLEAGRGELERMLESPVMSPRLMSMGVAAIAQLDGNPVKGFNSAKVDALLLARINSAQTPDATKAVALRLVRPNQPQLTLDMVRGLLLSKELTLQLEAVRYLNACSDPRRLALLAEVAGDSQHGVAVRAEAVVGLADDAEARSELLLQLAQSVEPALRQEALRSLRALAGNVTDARRTALEQVAKEHPAEAELVHRALGLPAPGRPDEADIAAWGRILDQGAGDADAGRRVFFHPNGPGCYRCHGLEGRGDSIGPELTMIGRSRTRSQVLESILQPSREIAPLFATWRIVTKSGQKFDGMLRSRTGDVEVFVDSGRHEFTARSGDIVERYLLKESTMPAGLVQGVTDQELRDLMAMLMQKR